MRTFLRLAFVSSLLVTGCFRRAPEPPTVTFEAPKDARGRALPPVDVRPVGASEVKIVDKDALPPGFHFDTSSRPQMVVAADYPTAATPNRHLGLVSIELTTERDKSEPLAAEPRALVQAEAAKRGANTLVEIASRRDMLAYGRGYRHFYYYAALFVSPEAPAYPSVADALAKLPLASEGFTELKRFDAKLEELGARDAEKLALRRGHEYRFAMAYHPEPIDVADAKPLGFLVEKDGKTTARGAFTEWVDRPRREGFNTNMLDGVFTRAGAGKVVHDVFVKEDVAIGFGAGMGPAPDARKNLVPGRGNADFVVFERALSPSELTDAACSRCYSVATACSKRRELSACNELVECFKKIQMPLSGCDKAYEKL